MAVADNTRMKGMEADIKRLFQLLESVTEEHRAERARTSEATNIKFDAIQHSIAQLAQSRTRSRSPSRELTHGSNSEGDIQPRYGLPQQRVNFDLPKFDGGDALGWIFSMDQYFDFFRVPEEEKLGIAGIHMTGPTVPWFQMSQRTAQFRSWDQLKRVIEIEFGPSLYESPRELLFKLQQSGSVGDYYSDFVALANRSRIEPPEALRDCFISGLKPDIRREVKAQCPPSLMRAVALARLYEDKFSPSPCTTSGPSISRPGIPTVAAPQPRVNNRGLLPPLLPTPNQRNAPTPTKTPIRKLSPAEIQIRRDKGLCYWCDEKFSASHRCTNRQFMLLQLGSDDLEDIDPSTGDMPPDLEILPQLEQQVLGHHLSCNAMLGTTGPAMIRIRASINGLEISALIDGGSSDSFIQPRIAKFLNLPIEPAPGVKVMVGDFDVLPVEGYLPALNVNLSGCYVTIPDVFVLHVAGGDLVIGTTWLKTLKAHIVDYDSSFLRFLHQGKFVIVNGEKSGTPAQAQFNHIKRLVSTDAIAAAFTLEVQPAAEAAMPKIQFPVTMKPELGRLLHTYEGVFAAPSGLPPQRTHDHSIPLVQGAAPVKSRPYRYPHSQKAQIELMVQEMLHEGIIQPSKSPFSSPILLVKKKDGT
ncbi:uncharacterized protein [Arachis hypogaea]|uniref:uncharacterized protein n=1 Tax=Arachis hypogaea TaxID=3818 RepID=UPI000DED149A|nr:uncharacterized protein LOC112709511 [Arachis hypogaea]